MMTIMIAAIVIGIGDDAIHYLHRFREERKQARRTTAARNSHCSIGNALYFTSLTVFVGFVLSFSSFVPTVYFGWLTAVAMGLAPGEPDGLPSLLVKAYR